MLSDAGLRLFKFVLSYASFIIRDCLIAITYFDPYYLSFSLLNMRSYKDLIKLYSHVIILSQKGFIDLNKWLLFIRYVCIITRVYAYIMII